jgi:tetratricopeptide (TPR) repeat protein
MNGQAKEIYARILKENPSNLQALLSASQFYKSLEDYDKAFNLLHKAFSDPIMDVDSKIQIVVGYLSGEDIFNQNKSDIKVVIDSLLSDYPENIKVHTVAADYYVRSNKFDKAAEELKFVLNKEKNNYVIWQQFLYIQSELGDFDLMYTFSKEALQYFTDKPELYMFYGLSCMQTDRPDEAVAAFQKGLKYTDNNKPLEIQIYTFLGDAYHQLKESSKSDDAFNKVLEMDPNNLLVLNNYSYYLSVRGEHLDKALDMIEEVIAKEPGNSTYLDTYAWILYKRGEFDKAKDVIEKAILAGGDSNSEIVNHYGDILNKLGAIDDAVKQWKKAIQLGGNSESIQKKISGTMNN